MSGVCGWFGTRLEDPAGSLAAMCKPLAGPRATVFAGQAGPAFGLSAAGPAGAVAFRRIGDVAVAYHGHPRWAGQGGPGADEEATIRRLVEGFRASGPDVLRQLHGDFVLAIIDGARHESLLAVDRAGIRNLVYHLSGDAVVFSASADSLAAHPSVPRELDPQAIYHYVHFHMVPGPGTIFKGQQRLLPGHYLHMKGGRCAAQAYWEMRFDESGTGSVASLEPAFRETLRSSVAACASGFGCGSFLSGGTDSSTVSGLLGDVTGAPAPTYSIGFDAAGYDEMEYARIAARHFKTDHHEYYVTPEDVVSAVPILAATYDQPFGNASAVPTYFCAKRAADDGLGRLLAGDGGDELFGGNARYAKQFQLSLYERVPAAVRSLVLEPAVLGAPGANRIPLLRKARSYIEQARLPMPERYESYNLLERLGPETVFSQDFLGRVDRTQPSRMMKTVYDGAHAGTLINRMLALDLKYTLADNDLPKVTRMCDAAGIDVAFPLLDDPIVEFSAKLPPGLKLKGTQLRYFFKAALRDYLPPEILAKEKHGFGLPVGAWLRSHAPLRSQAEGALARLGERGLFAEAFLRSLVPTRLNEHPGYYGAMVWVLMMLELWFQHHHDRPSPVSRLAR